MHGTDIRIRWYFFGREILNHHFFKPWSNIISFEQTSRVFLGEVTGACRIGIFGIVPGLSCVKPEVIKGLGAALYH